MAAWSTPPSPPRCRWCATRTTADSTLCSHMSLQLSSCRWRCNRYIVNVQADGEEEEEEEEEEDQEEEEEEEEEQGSGIGGDS